MHSQQINKKTNNKVYKSERKHYFTIILLVILHDIKSKTKPARVRRRFLEPQSNER